MSQERTTPAAAAMAAPNVQNGTYTIDHAERGHFTLKLHTVQKGDLAGKRIVSLLVGPDNEVSYKGVAFWDDSAKRAHVWRRFRSSGTNPGASIDGYRWSDAWSMIEKKLAIWADLVIRDEGTSYWRSHGYTLLREGRCVVCNRKLTDPESVRTGIGPVCAGRA